jgi:non-homologous end joining protein Ku
MTRSIWNGTIAFGLVAVPIKVHSATEDKGVHFHQVHATDGARIEHRRICSKEGKEVPYKEVANDLDLHFRQIHRKDGAPIDVLRFCSKEDQEVPYDEIARAYELYDGEDVIVTDEELEAVQPRRTARSRSSSSSSSRRWIRSTTSIPTSSCPLPTTTAPGGRSGCSRKR